MQGNVDPIQSAERYGTISNQRKPLYSMTQKLIHIVGGGTGQLPLVRRAKEMGHRVLVTDMYPEPPCKAEADIFAQVNTVDREATLATAREHGIDAITTDETDVALPAIAYVAETLGLPGIGHDTALRFTDKRCMREALQEICPESNPEARYFQDESEAIEYVRAQSETVVVKPVNSQGSRGVSILQSGSETSKAQIQEALEHSRGAGILIETFINGQEIAVESVVIDGTPRVLAMSCKEHYPGNHVIDLRVWFPAGLDPVVEQRVVDLNARIISGLGLPFGLTHAEYLIRDGQPWIVEIAARGAGSGVSSRIVPHVSGFDTATAIIQFALGEMPDIDIEDYHNRHVLLEFFDFEPGKIGSVVIDPKVREETLLFKMNVTSGDEITSTKDSRFRPGYFAVVADNLEELRSKGDEIRQGVRIEYT